MARATKAEKAQLVNAAYRLLEQRTETADAARRLADDFDLTLRQAYWYLEQAAALSAPVPDYGHWRCDELIKRKNAGMFV